MINAVTEELNQVLLEFHKMCDQLLKSVRYVWTHECLEKILLEFDQVTLLLEAEPEYDTIIFRVVNNRSVEGFATVDASHSEPWANLIGKPFNWGWVIVNQQNYLDGVLLSFDDLFPDLVLNVLASSISVSRVNLIPEDTLFRTTVRH